MKQTTKVLLPLGLFMSIVIPVTIKALFTDSDFFQNDESAKIDYLQPYKLKPESSLDMPNTVVVPVDEQETNTKQEKSHDRYSRKDDKLSMPNSTLPSDAELQLQLELQLQNEVNANHYNPTREEASQ